MGSLKSKMMEAIRKKQVAELVGLLEDHPGAVRYLISGLHATDDEELGGVLNGFRMAADVLDEERRLDLARRLMWLLNEESGNNCPNAALALAAMADIHPEAILPHLPVLKVYAEDPSDYIGSACRKAVALIKTAAKLEE
ncbi:hypothetical protein KQI63_07585 [bacterium]|nr:hypothetical protein [bacterium]